MASAADIAAGLGAHKASHGWMARCPAHRDRTPSLSITEGSDGRALVHCFGGCPQEAVVAALRDAGLWSSDGAGELTDEQREAARQRQIERERERRQRQARAIEIWRTARPIAGTPAAVYLKSRGIDPTALRTDPPGWPETLRWSADASTEPGRRAEPALVAAINDGRTHLCVAVHRVFLRSDGAPVLDSSGNKRKQALGPVGGNAIELSAPPSNDGRWGLAEGIEDAIAAEQLFATPVWSAVGGSNMRNVTPPSWARHITIFADKDPNSTGLDNAAAAMRAFEDLPQIESVRVLMADALGCKDAADVLKAGHG